MEWHKSSYSGSGNGSCVEVRWRKSSYSGGGNGACVEVAFQIRQVGVRDSKHATGPILSFTPTAWRTFATSVA